MKTRKSSKILTLTEQFGQCPRFTSSFYSLDLTTRSTSLEARPATRAKIPCLWEARCKLSSCDYRHPPCVVKASLKTGASTARELRFWKNKGSKVVYLKIQIQRSLFFGKLVRRDWALRRDTQKILRTHLVRNSNSGKTISRCYPKRWTAWAKSLRAEVWGKNTWESSRQEEYACKAAWNLAKKYLSSRPRTKLRSILLWE